MSAQTKLIAGEFKRLTKYNILTASQATAGIWVLLLLFMSAREALRIAPLLIFVDVSAMSILLLGASHHLEKQDGTMKTMMVLPVTTGQILAAKTCASVALTLGSAVATAVALYLIHRITFNYAFLLLFDIVACVDHAAIGLVLSLRSRGFNAMLGLLMAYMFVFTIPSIMFSLDVIDARHEWLLMISPSHCANHLMRAVVSGDISTGTAIGACAYLTILAAVLFKFAVFPSFKDNVVRG